MLVLTKICNKRYELPPQDPLTQTENIIVEPGTVIVVPVHSIQQLEKLRFILKIISESIFCCSDPNYYTNPDLFDPNRFVGENKNQYHKFAYLSFGEGQRICIGKALVFKVSRAFLPLKC